MSYNCLDKAIKNKEFKIYLQPRFSLTTGKIVGAESLVRWQREDGTILPPDSFIPVYEKNGRIIDLDFYMFEETVKLLANWKEQGIPQRLISINASALHAQNSDTVHRYTTILEKYGVDPALIELELTETATVSDYDHVKQLFAKLQTVAPTAKTFLRVPVSFFLVAPTKAGNIIKMHTNIIFFIFCLVAFLMVSKETARQRRHDTSTKPIDTMRITTRPYQTTSNTAQKRSDDARTERRELQQRLPCDL